LLKDGPVRHTLNGLLLVASWWFLSRWYLVHGTLYYLVFAVCFLSAVASILGPFLQSRLRELSWKCIIPVAFVLLLLLPYSEWLRLNPNTVRQEWSRQILIQSMALYGLYLLARLSGDRLIKVAERIKIFIARIASRFSLFWSIPFLYLCLSAWIALHVYQKVPLIEDSASYLFQAKIFARFHLFAPGPPAEDFFSSYRDLLVIKDHRWFSMYPPGFALLLGAAMWLRTEWLLSPLLGAAVVAIWMEYARRWHSRSAAFVLGLLMLASPFLLVMTSAVMVHTPELFIVSAMVLLCRLHAEGSGRMAATTGLFLLAALAVLVRFFSIIAFLTPVLLYSVTRKTRSRWFVPALAAGFATGFLLLGLYQWQTTGSPLISGYELEYPNMPGHHYGFGKAGAGEMHTPQKGLQNTSDNTLALDNWLSGLWTGSLFFFCAFFLLDSRTDPWDWTLLLSCLTVACFYFLYFFQDLSYGPRYFFVMAPLVLLLIVRSTIFGEGKYRRSRAVLSFILVASLLWSIPTKVPQLIQLCSPARREAGSLAREIAALGSRKTIVFLDHQITQTFVDWNDPFLNSVLLCHDFGERNQEVQKLFPGYATGYFRANAQMDMTKQMEQFRIFSTPESRATGHLSVYQLALTLLAAGDYEDKDIFDLCYADLFRRTELTSERLKFLMDALQTSNGPGDYRALFRRGIIHTGIMILLPLNAFGQSSDNWAAYLDRQAFLHEYQEARKDFSACGEIGKPFLTELDKVSSRMDQNGDGVFSDSEILLFAGTKRIH
jgi:hypothetical protein